MVYQLAQPYAMPREIKMKNYFAEKQGDNTYVVYGKEHANKDIEVFGVRGCNVRKTINALYAKDTARLNALIASIKGDR